MKKWQRKKKLVIIQVASHNDIFIKIITLETLKDALGLIESGISQK